MFEDAVRIQQEIQELLVCYVKGFRHLAAAICDVKILHRQTVRLAGCYAKRLRRLWYHQMLYTGVSLQGWCRSATFHRL